MLRQQVFGTLIASFDKYFDRNEKIRARVMLTIAYQTFNGRPRFDQTEAMVLRMEFEKF